MTLEQARNRAQELRALINGGQIDYTEGRKELEQVFKILDAEGEQIAKKYGRKYRPLNINAFLR